MPESKPLSLISEALYQTYLAYLLRGDRHSCNQMVQDLLAGGTDIRVIYLDLLQRSMYEVGELWETNRISVAKEHLASAVTEGVMALVYPQLFMGERYGRRGVISCIANEYHQIGGRMVADIFELNGWDGWFLGANTPEDSLLAYIHEKKPDVLCLSLAIYFNLPNLLAAIAVVRASYPHLDIFVGGQAFRSGGAEAIATHRGVTFVPSITRLEEMLSEGW